MVIPRQSVEIMVMMEMLKMIGCRSIGLNTAGKLETRRKVSVQKKAVTGILLCTADKAGGCASLDPLLSYVPKHCS
jgi:hypothetical protein